MWRWLSRDRHRQRHGRPIGRGGGDELIAAVREPAIEEMAGSESGGSGRTTIRRGDGGVNAVDAAVCTGAGEQSEIIKRWIDEGAEGRMRSL
jgi:hypothetical protein